LAAALASWRCGVDVVFAIVVDWAYHKCSVAVVSQRARARDRETSGGRCTCITLPLSGRRGQNATSTLAIFHTAIANAVFCRSCRTVLTSNTVLTIGKLTHGARHATAGGEAEATLIRTRQEGCTESARGESQSNKRGFHFERNEERDEMGENTKENQGPVAFIVRFIYFDEPS